MSFLDSSLSPFRKSLKSSIPHLSQSLDLLFPIIDKNLTNKLIISKYISNAELTALFITLGYVCALHQSTPTHSEKTITKSQLNKSPLYPNNVPTTSAIIPKSKLKNKVLPNPSNNRGTIVAKKVIAKVTPAVNETAKIILSIE